MTEQTPKGRAMAVPASRTRRLAGLGGMASGIAGSMAVHGVRQLAQGQRPDFRDLLLTPANAARIADQLAHMRGAAMKVGQIISMDAGDVLPPELSQILSRLRADADYMPPRQLREVLNAGWGKGWQRMFHRFDVRPIAAASIGQVHRAQTKDGRDLAIKVQYPGVARSIDSDVQNVATLIRMSGLIPKDMDLAPVLEEAKVQLKEEADYLRERDQITRFAALLEGDEAFLLPQPQDDLTTKNILSMTYVPGDPIESLSTASQHLRDQVLSQMIQLMFREVFEFGFVQSDPNFANYRYNLNTGQIVLLDFGAARDVPSEIARDYANLFRAALEGDDLHDPALALGFFAHSTAERHRRMVLDMMQIVFGPLTAGGLFDFGDPSLSRQMQDVGLRMAAERDFVHVPPVETLFLQRKFGGLFLLGSRLKARVDISALIKPFL